jgi:hypothetical protein
MLYKQRPYLFTIDTPELNDILASCVLYVCIQSHFSPDLSGCWSFARNLLHRIREPPCLSAFQMRLRGHRRQQKLKEKGDALTLWKMSILLHINALVTVGGCKARKYHLLINITC